MKLIYKVARTELRNLFYSPIAWFLTVAFMVQCALTYATMLHWHTASQEMGGFSLQFLTRLTYKTFTGPYGSLFSTAIQNLYLYIPLLTMGLISREMNGGTISLLYSSPVRVSEIVLGKYLAMMIYSFVLIGVLAIFMISGLFQLKSPDVGLLYSATLGFYLLLCAYAAIGLFMSCLTSYQVVAAVGTFMVIGILSYIGQLWQGIDFVRDLTWFLSINGRTQHMLAGLITTKDVLYFILIVYMFVGFTICRLKTAREYKPAYVRLTRYTVILASTLLLGYISSRPLLIGYWDVTANKDNTLTVKAQEITKDLKDGPLEVTVYNNFLDNFSRYGLPEDRNSFLERWEPYRRFKSDIKFNFVYYYDIPLANGYDIFKDYKGKTLKEIMEKVAKGREVSAALFKTPEEIRRVVDLRPELNRFVMQLKYKDRTTYLRVFNDQSLWPSETEVSAAFKRLLQDRMPKILLATGNGERNMMKKGERAYNSMIMEKTFRYTFVNQGFDADTLSLETQPIPDSITALVIADPLTSLSPAAIEKVRSYIAKGGNILIAGEPGRQDIINPLIKDLGVQLMDGMLEQRSEDFMPSIVLPVVTKAAAGFSPILSTFKMDTLFISMNGVSALRYADTAGFKVTPLLQTIAGRASNTTARNPDLDMVGPQTADATTATKIMTVAPTTITTTQQGQTYTTALALTRSINGREQRIIIAGDADFMSNGELSRDRPPVLNFPFSTTLFSWLDYGQFPINTSRPEPKDTRVRITSNDAALLKILYVWIIPALIAIFGTVLLIRRKRK